MSAREWYEDDDANDAHADSLAAVLTHDAHDFERTCWIAGVLQIEKCAVCGLCKTSKGKLGAVLYLYPHPEGTRYADEEPACTPAWFKDERQKAATRVERVLAEGARREKRRLEKDGIDDGHEDDARGYGDRAAVVTGAGIGASGGADPSARATSGTRGARARGGSAQALLF